MEKESKELHLARFLQECRNPEAVKRQAESNRRNTARRHALDAEARKLVKENERRLAALCVHFDPISGAGSVGERFEYETEEIHWWLPVALRDNEFLANLKKCGSFKQFCVHYNMRGQEDMVRHELFWLRCHEDFPFWAASIVTIKNKQGGGNIKFVLNYPQRLVLAELERQRLANRPIRMIILKARQWGGSTLVQMYMAWIQLMHRKAWYSAIVAHQSSAALKIKAMYDKMIANYPPSMLGLDSGMPLRLTPYSGSRTDYTVTQNKLPARDTVISIGSMQSPESIRATDVALVHYSEVGLWKQTEGRSPEDLVQSISSSVLDEPMTMDVMESTAKGEHNLFHNEWLDAKNGESSRVPIFVPWYQIELYRKPFGSDEERFAFARTLYEKREEKGIVGTRKEPGSYYWKLWQEGCTLEALNWYQIKRRTYRTHETMASEFPSDDVEAFAHSGQSVFDRYHLDKLKELCCMSPRFVGEVMGDEPSGAAALRHLQFVEDTQGQLRVWELPDTSFKHTDRYVVAVDIGGVSDKADYSDIVVIDRWWRTEGEGDVVVAEWHGHIRHDMLAWKMMQIAAFYCDALLVPESNTFTRDMAGVEGDHSKFVLDQIGMIYRNLYTREAGPEKLREGRAREWGFHTNALTKALIIDNLKMLVDKRLYTEREREAIAEMGVYQRDERGHTNAAQGYHDDRVMARAIGLYVSGRLPIPREGGTPIGLGYSAGLLGLGDINESAF